MYSERLKEEMIVDPRDCAPQIQRRFRLLPPFFSLTLRIKSATDTSLLC